MFEMLERLLILQERDTKIFKASQELEEIPEEADKIKSAFQERIYGVKNAKESLQKAQKDVSQLELDRQTRKETVLKLKTRQGETKKNEEYQMLSHEVIRYEKEIDILETKELELMELVDLRKKERSVAEEELTKEKAFATERSENLVAKKKHAELKVLEVKETRKNDASKVDSESLALYERIIKSKGIGAIVRVTESGQCTGCNMKIPPATIHRVQAEKELIQCNECSRILYIA